MSREYHPEYQLIVETDEKNHLADFRLLDKNGAHLGDRQVKLPEHALSYWEGLFDTRQFIDRYAGSMILEGDKEAATEDQLLDRLGLFLGREVLGEEIMTALSKSRNRRTLLVRLPETTENSLAAAFARVPWEIARLSEEDNPLMHQNLIVRMVTEDTSEPDGLVLAEADRVKSGEVPLKVLFVFAEAPGSRPLAMRLEREKLRQLFFTDILPRNRVQVDFLCHGVTRATLRDQIQKAGGYHIVHWSGHGHLNLLELAGGDGEENYITGPELAALFSDAGGFIPHLVFLSACLSGTFIDVKSWGQLQAVLTGENPDAAPPSEKNADGKTADARILTKVLGEETGYTGTALTLLRSGVPQVAAMRYEVGDAYARELALQFYRHFLADPGRHTADAALTLARGDLLHDRAAAARLGAVNHATPLMFGQPGRLLDPQTRRSEQMNRRDPRPRPLLPARNRELDPREDFTGRGRELTRLNVEWLTPGGPPVALIQGLAGMGKTALAAEAVHLWHTRFDWVFAFQAKPTALQADEFYRQMDFKMAMDSTVYRDKCNASPNDKIFLEPNPDLPAEYRYERMRRNLIEALRDEAVLIVLDNFETNLKEHPVSIKSGESGESSESDGPGGYACRNPEWDALLDDLTEELPGAPSRILITSRHLPGVLAEKEGALWLPLGPLPLMEAALFVRNHELLAGLIADKGGTALLHRLLKVSRCHPLIMNRLAALANDPASLNQALETLESQGLRNLPDLFAAGVSEADREKERDYLEDVASGAVDYLIERLSPEARRLLWMMTLANEPVTEELMAGVWGGKSAGDEQMEQIRQLVNLAEIMPDGEKKEQLQAMLSQLPPELLEQLKNSNADGDKTNNTPPVADLLNQLHISGLITREVETDQKTETPVFAFHELVRERMAEWMDARPDETGGRAVKDIWIAYGERYAVAFEQLRTSGRERAMETASEAGRRALVYMVRAEAYDRLGSFASGLVTGTRDPALLRGVIAELEGLADKVPPGETRWLLRTYLADALLLSGRPDKALPFYEQAAAEAEAAENWSDVGWICGNWANALQNVGLLDRAKDTHLKSAEAFKKAKKPEIHVVAHELEAFRIDVYQGKAEAALPEIESRLYAVRGWRRQRKNGETVPEAPDDVILGRALVSGLDIAIQANYQLENWEACLSLLEEIEQNKRESGQSRHEQHRTRFNQYGPLMKLGRLDEARKVLEECLAVFREADDLTMQAMTLSALSDIWNERGDMNQAIALQRQALEVRNRLPDPEKRAISHHNLAIYFEKAGRNEEMIQHDLAAGIYFFVSSRGDHMKTWLNNLRGRLNRAAESNTTYTLPHIADLIVLPEFEALNRFLVQNQVDVEALQQKVDELAAGLNQDGQD